MNRRLRVKRRHFVYLTGLTFFTLPTNYSTLLHQKLFQLLYYSNGGFNWTDLYTMPIKFREFYWRELLKTKEEEKKAAERVYKSNTPSSKARKR